MKITNAFFDQNIMPDSPLIKLCRCNGLPTKNSYWLSRLLQKLEPLNNIFGNERKKLIEKWCDKKEDGTPDAKNGQYKLSEHVREFNAEYQELLAIELEINMDMIEISIEKIPDCHECKQELCPQYKKGLLNSYDYNRLTGIIEFKEI